MPDARERTNADSQHKISCDKYRPKAFVVGYCLCGERIDNHDFDVLVAWELAQGSLQAEVERLRAVVESIACSEAPDLPHPDDPRIRLYAGILRVALKECGDAARAALPPDHVLNRIVAEQERRMWGEPIV